MLFAFISRFFLSAPETTPETVSAAATTEPKQIIPTAPKNNYPKVSAADGDVIIFNDYAGTCPFEINLSVREQARSDFFVFLEFVSIFPQGSDPETVIAYVEQGKSFKSGDMRELGNYARWKKEKEPNYKPRANLGIYLSTTTTYTTDIPLGCYRIWYCSGETWYGTDHYFGDDTVWYTSDDILTFYEDDNYTYGQTITLFLVEGGNMDTRTAFDFELPNDLK